MMTIAEWAKRYNITAAALRMLRQILKPTVTGRSTILKGTNEEFSTHQIRLATNLTSGVLWRNNSGAMQDKTGRVIRFGLANDSAAINKKFKSSDLIGLTPVKITPEMVGQEVAIFTAIEVKRPAWKYRGSDHDAAQLSFINVVKSRGGIAGFATCSADYLAAVTDFTRVKYERGN